MNYRLKSVTHCNQIIVLPDYSEVKGDVTNVIEDPTRDPERNAVGLYRGLRYYYSRSWRQWYPLGEMSYAEIIEVLHKEGATILLAGLIVFPLKIDVYTTDELLLWFRYSDDEVEWVLKTTKEQVVAWYSDYIKKVNND